MLSRLARLARLARWGRRVGCGGLPLVATLVAACASAKVGASPPRPVEYHVAIPKPHTQYVEVRMQVPTASASHTDVSMPAWAPGSYIVRDFARHVYDLGAVSVGGAPLSVERLDKQTWRIHNRGRGFAVRYRVFAAERSVRASHVDDRHATLNGPSVFLYLRRDRERDCRVSFELPADWQVYTALPSAGPNAFSCRDYDALVDAPFELGRADVRKFEIGGTRFEYVVSGDLAGIDTARLAGDAQRFTSAFARLMGGLPMHRYVFLVNIADQRGGGLEHDDSTLMQLGADAMAGDDGYLSAARLGAHEFFHVWNVRRIRDRALRPYDYDKETYSRLLWFHEGFTNTAESLAMVRAGLIAPPAFLHELAELWTRYLQRAGRNYDPLTELSFEAWTKQYQPAANHPNVSISYYAKGEVIGLALDLELRLRGGGDLFGMFKRLMQSHGNTGRGIELRDIVEAASAEAKQDMGWFFERYVRGTDEVPLPALLERIGIEVRAKAPWETKAGQASADPAVLAKRSYSGLEFEGTKVRNVIPDSPGAAAGAMLGDEIVAVEGRRVTTPQQIASALATAGPGKRAAVHAFREGRLVAYDIALIENPFREYEFVLRPAAGLDPKVRALRDAWLEVYGVEAR